MVTCRKQFSSNIIFFIVLFIFSPLSYLFSSLIAFSMFKFLLSFGMELNNRIRAKINFYNLAHYTIWDFCNIVFKIVQAHRLECRIISNSLEYFFFFFRWSADWKSTNLIFIPQSLYNRARNRPFWCRPNKSNYFRNISPISWLIVDFLLRQKYLLYWRYIVEEGLKFSHSIEWYWVGGFGMQSEVGNILFGFEFSIHCC